MYILYVACKLYKRLTAFNILQDKTPFLKYYHIFIAMWWILQLLPAKRLKMRGKLQYEPVMLINEVPSSLPDLRSTYKQLR